LKIHEMHIEKYKIAEDFQNQYIFRYTIKICAKRTIPAARRRAGCPVKNN